MRITLGLSEIKPVRERNLTQHRHLIARGREHRRIAIRIKPEEVTAHGLRSSQRGSPAREWMYNYSPARAGPCYNAGDRRSYSRPRDRQDAGNGPERLSLRPRAFPLGQAAKVSRPRRPRPDSIQTAERRILGVKSGKRRSPAPTGKPPPTCETVVMLGAGDRTRTGDPHLGKVMLYQLSHARGLSHCNSFRFKPSAPSSRSPTLLARRRADPQRSPG